MKGVMLRGIVQGTSSCQQDSSRRRVATGRRAAHRESMLRRKAHHAGVVAERAPCVHATLLVDPCRVRVARRHGHEAFRAVRHVYGAWHVGGLHGALELRPRLAACGPPQRSLVVDAPGVERAALSKAERVHAARGRHARLQWIADHRQAQG